MLTMVMVSGCSGSIGQQSPVDNATPVATRTDSARSVGTDNDAGPQGNPDKENTGSGDDGLAWVPFGPKDPTFPTPSWPAYNAFAEGKCDQLQDYLSSDDGAGIAESDLALAMVAVCQAAFLGEQEQWDVAKEHASADAEGIQNTCLDAAVRELLKRALAWHDEHPGQKPVVQIQRVDAQTECGKGSPEVDDDAPPDEPTETPSAEPTETAE